MDEQRIYTEMGRMSGVLEEIRGIVKRTEERNNEEHKDFRDEINVRALKTDVDNLGIVTRKQDVRITALESRPDKELATKTRGVAKWFFTIAGAMTIGAVASKLFEILNLFSK